MSSPWSREHPVALARNTTPSESVSGKVRIADLVAPRKIPPGTGWRKLVHQVSFKTINPGESPAERHERGLRERIRRHIRRQYVIGVVSGKGGVGKTTMAACIGAVFRECRPDHVVAVDAVPGFGTLAGRIDEAAPGDYTAVLDDVDMQSYADIREHLGQNAVGLDVLAGDRHSDQARPLTPAMFDGVLARLRRTHTVIVADTADDFDHPSMGAVLSACDTVVFVAGLTPDTSSPITRAIDLLRAMGHHDLVSRSVVVLNDSRDARDEEARAYLTERFRQCGADVEFMPFDAHLAKGGIIDTVNELGAASRIRLLEIAAGLADKFSPDTDRPQ